jgi:hypothetical protein
LFIITGDFYGENQKKGGIRPPTPTLKDYLKDYLEIN